MLLDDVKDLPSSGWGRFLHPAYIKELRSDAMRARPYVFDRAASIKLGQFIRSCPDILADQLEFAKLPFPITYIEVEIDAVHEGIGRPVSMNGPNADWKLGFLANDKGQVRSFANNHVKTEAIANAVGYQERGIEYAEAVRLWTESAYVETNSQIQLLGSSMQDIEDERRRKFTSRFHVHSMLPSQTPMEILNKVIEAHTGEIRVYVAALLMLQQKRAVSVGDRTWERRITRGKSRVFMAHSVVTITIDGPIEMRRAFSITDRDSPRAHEVPAHYAHRYGERACEHEWIPRDDGTDRHWDCPKCGRFRYFKKHHMRGDASKGYVTREYNVTTQEEQR
jgi:hypothetical protein